MTTLMWIFLMDLINKQKNRFFPFTKPKGLIIHSFLANLLIGMKLLFYKISYHFDYIVYNYKLMFSYVYGQNTIYLVKDIVIHSM